MDLSQTDYNPAGPAGEDQAYQALSALESPPEGFDSRLGLIERTPRELAVETLGAYRAHREKAGLPLFPATTAALRKAATEHHRKLFAGLDKLGDALAPEQLAQVESMAKLAPDPDAFRARAVVRQYLGDMTGGKVTPETFDFARDNYARTELGLKDDTGDVAVYNAISNRHRENDAAATATADLSRAAFERIITTGDDDKEARDLGISLLGESHRAGALEAYYAATHEARTIRRRNKPVVDEIKGIVAEAMAEDATDGYKPIDTKEAGIWKRLDALADKLPDHPQERAVVLAMLQAEWQKLPKADMEALGRFYVGLGRGINLAQDSIADFSMTQKRGIAKKAYDWSRGESSGPQDTVAVAAATAAENEAMGESKHSPENLAFYDKRRVMRDMVLGMPADLSRAADSYMTGGFIKAAPSAWMLPATLLPGGMGIVAASIAGDSAMNDRAASPRTDEGWRAVAAIGSGSAQAAIETGLNVTGMKFFKARVPSLFTLFNKAGVSTRLGRGVAGTAVTGAAIYVGEYAEEAAQGVTDLALQGLAAELSGLNPKIDFAGYLGKWLKVSGQEQRDTLQAILPYMLIGAGGAGVNHFKAGSAFLKNRTMLRGMGLSEAEARPVLTAETPEAAEAAFKAGLEAATERGANLTPEEEARLEQHRKDAIETLRAQNEALAGAGLARVEREHNDFTEEDQFIFVHPEDGSRKVFETEEAALAAYGDWSRAVDNDNVEAVQEAAHAGFLEHLTSEGQAGENVNAEVSAKTLTLPKVQAELEAEQKAAANDAAKASNAVARRQAQERMDQAATSLGWLKSRMQVMLFDMGLTPAQAGEAFKNTVILGRVFAQKAAGRVLGYTVQLFHGHQVQDIAEEFSEANMREAFDAGFADPEILLDDIRRYEVATGAKVIEAAYQYDPANPVPLLEGFSKLARGYMMSEVRSGALPETVRKWIEMQTALTAAAVNIAKGFSGHMAMDLGTAKELREAIAAGYLPERLQRQLADAVGLDPQAQERRLQKKMEDQLAAEAMEGFPEVSETLAGQLPHPETLRKNGHPLYGEVRRIWEALKKPTRRKDKQGRAIDRTNEANGFFLPVGTMEDLDDVRQRANERGFEFETPADMLNALDISISYGKPFYGTGSGVMQGEAGYSMVLTAEDLRNNLLDRIGEEGLRLEQPKASYADKRQLLFDFAKSITEPAGQGTGTEGDRRFNSLRIIGQKFSEKISRDLQCRFIGEEIKSAEDLAIKAQALRNPLFETFYLLGIDSATGTLKGAMIARKLLSR
jgi:hypothetical protein